jgi:NADPH-dependent 2,4-dienoyl-CoA reductase/sulfur reductase-like enzyme
VVLVIVGGDLGACYAAHEYRKLVRREEVILVTDSAYVGYARTLLPYYAAGLVKSPVLLSEELLSVADLVKVVQASSFELTESGEAKIGGKYYANPRLLFSLWPALREQGAIDLLTPEDAELLRERVDEGRSVTVAGGCAALPVVDAMLRAGVKVQLVWSCESFDDDIARLMLQDLERLGVKTVPEIPRPERGEVVVNYGWGRALGPPQLGLGGAGVRVDRNCKVLGCARDVYALGLATEVVEPEGLAHRVGSEEEVILQALNFASSAVDASTPAVRRYAVARVGERVYASLGLTQREAEGLGIDCSATRVRGWGVYRDIVVKAVASREGALLGVQVVARAELSPVIGLLYFAVAARANLSEISRVLSPLNPSEPSLGDPFGKAFKALYRKAALRPEAKRAQRAPLHPNDRALTPKWPCRGGVAV